MFIIASLKSLINISPSGVISKSLSAKNLVVDLMKNDTYKDIQKICTFISGEIFQKTLLNENSWYN